MQVNSRCRRSDQRRRVTYMTTTSRSRSEATSDRRCGVPLDLADALELLHAAVGSRPSEHIPRPLGHSSLTEPALAYAYDSRPAGILGHALHLAGIALDALEALG